MSKIQKELVELTGVRVVKDRQKTLKRICDALVNPELVTDEDFKKISDGAYDWFEKAEVAIENEEDLPEFPDYTEEEEDSGRSRRRSRRDTATEPKSEPEPKDDDDDDDGDNDAEDSGAETPEEVDVSEDDLVDVPVEECEVGCVYLYDTGEVYIHVNCVKSSKRIVKFEDTVGNEYKLKKEKDTVAVVEAQLADNQVEVKEAPAKEKKTENNTVASGSKEKDASLTQKELAAFLRKFADFLEA